MANNKDKDQSNQQSPDTVICEKLKEIKNEKASAESAAEASETQVKSSKTSKAYKICCLDKAEETYAYYDDINVCVSISNSKKSEIIQKYVDDYVKKDAEIETKIKELSVLINDLKTKMEDAHNEACAMSNCVKNKLFPKRSKSSSNSILNSLKDIMDETKTLDEKGQNAFDSIVTFAGLQTFTNTDSLKVHIKEFLDKMKIFKEYVESNVTSTAEEVKTFKDELKKIMEELGQVECDWHINENHKEAITRLRDFICEYECDEDCIDLCKEIEMCFDKDDDDNQSNYNKRMRQSRDQN